MMLWRSIGLELLMGRLAFLLIFVSLAEIAKELDVLDLLRPSLDPRTLQVVPTGSSALGLIAALDPERLLDDLPADALFFLLIFIGLYPLHILLPFGLFLGHTLVLLFLTLVLPLALLRLVNVLLLEVVEHDAFQIERVEECSFGKGKNMVWVDGADLESMLSLLDNLTILGDFCDLSMATVDGLQEVILIIHGLNGVFDVLKILLVVRVGLDQLDHFIPLLHGHSQAEFEQSQMLHIHTPAHDLIINIQPDLTQIYSYNPPNKPAFQITFPWLLINMNKDPLQFILRCC